MEIVAEGRRLSVGIADRARRPGSVALLLVALAASLLGTGRAQAAGPLNGLPTAVQSTVQSVAGATVPAAGTPASTGTGGSAAVDGSGNQDPGPPPAQEAPVVPVSTVVQTVTSTVTSVSSLPVETPAVGQQPSGASAAVPASGTATDPSSTASPIPSNGPAATVTSLVSQSVQPALDSVTQAVQPVVTASPRSAAGATDAGARAARPADDSVLTAAAPVVGTVTEVTRPVVAAADKLVSATTKVTAPIAPATAKVVTTTAKVVAPVLATAANATAKTVAPVAVATTKTTAPVVEAAASVLKPATQSTSRVAATIGGPVGAGSSVTKPSGSSPTPVSRVPVSGSNQTETTAPGGAQFVESTGTSAASEMPATGESDSVAHANRPLFPEPRRSGTAGPSPFGLPESAPGEPRLALPPQAGVSLAPSLVAPAPIRPPVAGLGAGLLRPRRSQARVETLKAPPANQEPRDRPAAPPPRVSSRSRMSRRPSPHRVQPQPQAVPE